MQAVRRRYGVGVGLALTLLSSVGVLAAGNVNGFPLNVSGMTLQSGVGIQVSQAVPAAAAHYVPPSVANLPRRGRGRPAPRPGGSYSLAAARPDFTYNAGRQDFRQAGTATSGQKSMSTSPGLPAGTTRYIPVGEF